MVPLFPTWSSACMDIARSLQFAKVCARILCVEWCRWEGESGGGGGEVVVAVVEMAAGAAVAAAA